MSADVDNFFDLDQSELPNRNNTNRQMDWSKNSSSCGNKSHTIQKKYFCKGFEIVFNVHICIVICTFFFPLGTVRREMISFSSVRVLCFAFSWKKYLTPLNVSIWFGWEDTPLSSNVNTLRLRSIGMSSSSSKPSSDVNSWIMQFSTCWAINSPSQTSLGPSFKLLWSMTVQSQPIRSHAILSSWVRSVPSEGG